MRYTNIHGQPVSVDTRALVLTVCRGASHRVTGKTHVIYNAPDNWTTIGAGATEEAAWFDALRRIEEEAVEQATKDAAIEAEVRGAYGRVTNLP